MRDYADALQSGVLTPNLWLAPNARATADIRSQLLAAGLDACLRPGVMTFHDLTGLILTAAKVRSRTLRPVAERELLRRVVEEALRRDKLQFFAEAAQRAAFIDLFAEHIHELKRSDISPAAYTKLSATRADDQQLRELALLCSEYEALLAAHSLADEESSLCAARDVLASNQWGEFYKLNLVVVDGFTDFTRTQHGILHLLAARANRLLVSLPSEDCEISVPRTGRLSDQSEVPGAHARSMSSPRTDLFAKTASTLYELKHHHPQLELRELPSRAHPWPALDHVLKHVFRNPNQVPAPSAEALASLDRLQLVAAASTHDEIVQIARRIKQQLVPSPLSFREGPGEGSLTPSTVARPGDIVVVFRSLADVAPRMREVFDQFGIPYALDARASLAAAPIVNTLLTLLRLDIEDWPFRRVVSVITNNMLTAFDDRARQSAEWFVRDLQIAGGRDKLLSRVEHFAAIDTPIKQLGDHTARRVAAARAAQPLFQLLTQSLNDLPQDAAPSKWCAALAAFAAQLGVCDFRDSTAWAAIEGQFAALERLDAWLDLPPRELSRRELVRAFVDVARQSLPPAHDDVGRVRVVAAPAARMIRAKHLYLAGMSEQSFPAPEPAGQLGTGADYRFLARAADQAWAAKAAEGPAAPTRFQEEMLLFYEVLSRAEESLTISYPALDDKAQELPPSPYVLEIQRVFGEANRDRLKSPPPQLSPVPAPSAVYSTADWRIRAVASAIDTRPDLRLLAGVFADAGHKQLGNAIDAALRIVHQRAHGDSCGPAEGLLTSPAVAARLAKKFGADHDWSPSQWETYASCPYRFFAQDVLKLAPLGDLALETDYSRRGSRLHNVLAAFHRQWPALRETLAMPADDEQRQFLDHLCRVIDERIPVGADGGVDSALTELDRRQVLKWAQMHYEHHVKYHQACSKRGAPMKPTHLEFRFGPSRAGDDEQDPDSIDRAFVLDINGEQVRVTGQIDRIDVGTIDGKKVFNVIDYKSGKKPTLDPADIASGERLQLPLYVEAAQALLFDGQATPLAAGYWSMASGFDAKSALAVEVEGDAAQRWQQLRGIVEERIGQFVNDIRHGDFPVASRDDKCTSYCDFNTICRIAQIRSLNKSVSSTTACGSAQTHKDTTNPGDP